MRRPQFNSWVRKIHWRRDRLPTPVFLGFHGGSAGKESACNVGDLGSIPGLGRSPWRRERLPTPVFWPGEFHRQRSLAGSSPRCHKTRTQLSDFSWATFTSYIIFPQEDLLEKGMATHSSILNWEIPWTEEPGRLQSTGPWESDTT